MRKPLIFAKYALKKCTPFWSMEHFNVLIQKNSSKIALFPVLTKLIAFNANNFTTKINNQVFVNSIH